MQEVFGSKNKKKRSVGFSSRVDEEWFEVLRAEAERQGISVNAIINRIIKNYCRHYRWTERFGGGIHNSSNNR